MTQHRVRPKTVHDSPRGARKLGTCAVCGENVEVAWGGLSWRCVQGEREKKRLAVALEVHKRKTARNRVTDRKRAVRSRERAKKKDSETLAWLWRQICYHRAEFRCELCGKECEPGVFGANALHAHHVIKRSQSKRLQLDPANAMAVCAGCHQGADRDPVRCMAILQERDPGIVDYLLAERRNTAKVDMDFTRKRLIETARMYGIEVPE